MRRISEYSFILTFIWLGFVIAISFLEAQVKFSAPSLTLPVGLDVGRHVFFALNKVEIAFALFTILLIIFSRVQLIIIILLLLILIILAMQTFWLLPQLSARVDIYLRGEIPPESSLHIYYIVIEIAKVIFLFFLGWFQIKNLTKNYFLNISKDRSFIPGNP